jgi:hypothetical protein
MRDNMQNAVSVNYSLSGKAGNGADYQLLNGWVTFEAGQEFVEIPISVIDDELIEDDFELVLLTLNPYSVDGIQQYTLDYSKEFPVTSSLTIQDNDIPCNVWIDSFQNTTEGERDGNGWFRLRRDQVKGNLTIHYTVTGTASTNGSDYTKLTGTVTFNNNDEFVYVPINVVDDNLNEWDETITLTLNSNRVDNHDQYYFENTAEHPVSTTITLCDNDRTNVWIEKGEDAVEGTGEGYVLVKRDNTKTRLTVYFSYDKKVSMAIKNEDFENLSGMELNSTSGQVTFEIGEDTVRIPIISIDDTILEHPETVIIKLRVAGDAPASDGSILPAYQIDSTKESKVTILIHDNDVKQQVWFETKQDATEVGEKGYARVWRSDATDDLRISYRINNISTGVLGQDYEYPPGMSTLNTETGFISFAKGAYYVDIPIRVIDNSLLDGTRTVSITIIPGDETVGGVNTIYDIDESRNTIDVSIFDDDVKTTLRIGEIKHATEGGENGYVRVDRDNSRTELTFNYILDVAGSTASMGDDFAQLPGMKSGSTFGTFTFKAGESSVYIPITVFDDNLIETDKTVRIVLTTGNGNYELDENFEAIVTIKDNDRPTNIRVETIQHGIEGEQDIFIRLHRDQTDKLLTVTFEYDKNTNMAVWGTNFYRLFLNFTNFLNCG